MSRLAAALAWPVGLYFGLDIFLDSEGPDTFSAGSWALMLLPPTVLAITLVAGFSRRNIQPTRHWLFASRASAVIVTLTLVLACVLSLSYLFVELYDYGVG